MIAHDAVYELEKSIWTENDFDRMGWHDVRVHGISFASDSYQILFDLDYIYAWVEPVPESTYYSFWISPCTLIFDNISDLKIDIESENVEILAITRSEIGAPENAALIGKSQQWTWTIECTSGEISFKSVGYTQYTRQAPRHVKPQSLSVQARGGVCFDIPVTPEI